MPVTIHSIRVGVSFCYLIEGGDGAVLVDTGSRGHERRIIRHLRHLGCDNLRLVFITHAHLDHYGSAAALRRVTGAPVGIHEADSAVMERGETPLGDVRGWGRVMRGLMPVIRPFTRPEPAQAEILFEGGERFDRYGVDAELVHTPGHTPGSSVLVVEGRHAFVGDLVSTRWRDHAQLFYATDWAALARSLQRLQKLDLEWIYTGHGGRPMSGKAFKTLKARV